MYERIRNFCSLATSCLVAAAAGLATVLAPGVAVACGCFAQFNPAVPVVQGGERIIFIERGGGTEMHVGVTYQGDPEEFGWLIPVPQVPDVRLGSERFFDALGAATQPRVQLNPTDFCGGGLTLGCADSESGVVAHRGDTPNDPVISREQVGPFDTVVLDASDRVALQTWLTDNDFFVDEDPSRPILDDYVGPGLSFLALRLAPGAEVGDIQPLVLTFEGEVMTIPLKLTRVGSVPDMPITVWVLGSRRAVPLNYAHVLPNLEHLDWFTAANYMDVVSAAVNEAPDGHGFITELSGPTDQVAPFFETTLPGVGPEQREQLESQTDIGRYMQQLWNFAPIGVTNPVLNAMSPHAPVPPELDIDPIQYLVRLLQDRDYAAHLDRPFDPKAATDAIWNLIVIPEQEANRALSESAWITRMFTTISPDEMTEDPRFGFNPDLPEVSAVLTAAFEPDCDAQPAGWAELDDGRLVYVEPQPDVDFDTPAAVEIQAMGLEGPPRTLVDRRGELSSSDGGCRTAPASDALMLLVVWLTAFAVHRRRLARRQPH